MMATIGNTFMNWKTALVLGAMMATGAAMAVTPEQHAEATEAWRTQRLERLRLPGGWLSLIGLHTLEPGRHRIGSAAGNDIVLAKGPERLGALDVGNDGVVLQPQPDAGLAIEGAGPVSHGDDGGRVSLLSDATDTPTLVSFDHGKGSMVLIERGGRLMLRVRHAEANTRTGFTSIDHYPVDVTWRIAARFEPHPPGSTIDIANVLGQLEPLPNPGAVVFERDGRQHRIEAVDEAGQLFLIFADRSNRKDTYGAGRFLYADHPAAGSDTVVVDFNRAYNPPCAFNAYSTCPLPPPENRLDLVVDAGEKRYTGPTH